MVSIFSTPGIWFLTQVPTAVVVLIIITVCSPDGIVFFSLAQWKKRMPNVSFSGGPGDVALIAVIVIAANVLSGQNLKELPLWFTSSWYQWLAVIVSVIAGLMANATDTYSRDNLPDTYHNILIAPIYIYLVGGVSIPTLFFAYFGYVHTSNVSIKVLSAVLLIVFYLALVVFDFLDKRINQPEWWAHGKGREIINKMLMPKK